MSSTDRTYNRRTVIAGLAGMAAVATSGRSYGQAYPNKPVRILTGYGPGSGADLAIRLVAEQLSKQLGQPFVIEPRPGAGNLLAARIAKDAPADGYTLLAANPAAFGPVFLKSGIDGTKELTPIGEFSRADPFVFTSPDIPSIQALIERGKRAPVRIGAVHGGAALVNAMFAQSLQIKYELIPYKTAEQIVQALVANDVQATIRSAGGAMELVSTGKLGLVGTLSPARSALAPAVPSSREFGLSFSFVISNGLWGPLGLPASIVSSLNTELQRALSAPKVVDGMQRSFQYPHHSTPEALLENLVQETQIYAKGAVLTGFERN